MQAILLHKDDELSLIRAQKSFLLKLNGTECPAVALPRYPLFIPLGGQHCSADLRVVIQKNDFSKVEIFPAAICGSEIYSPVTIELKNGKTFSSKIILGELRLTDKDFSKETGSFHKALRIFRLADIKKTGAVFEIQSPVWCKIK